MSSTASILLAVCDPNLRRRILRVVEENDLETVGVVEDSVEAVQIVIAYGADLAVVEQCPSLPWGQLCNYIRLAAPQSSVILLADGLDDQTINDAMLLGIRQVLNKREAPEKLVDVLNKLQALADAAEADEYVMATDPGRCPRLIAVSGAKGGVGKTTLATNLGVMLAGKNVGSVAVWDAYSQFGDVGDVMAISSARPLAELAELNQDLDEDIMLNCMVHHDSGADVLLTSDKPVPWDLFGEPFVHRVLKVLRSKYRFTVVDTPLTLHPIANLVFAACWRPRRSSPATASSRLCRSSQGSCQPLCRR